MDVGMMVHMNARSMNNLNYECEQINTETSLYYSLEAFASNVTRMCLRMVGHIGLWATKKQIPNNTKVLVLQLMLRG